MFFFFSQWKIYKSTQTHTQTILGHKHWDTHTQTSILCDSMRKTDSVDDGLLVDWLKAHITHTHIHTHKVFSIFVCLFNIKNQKRNRERILNDDDDQDDKDHRKWRRTKAEKRSTANVERNADLTNEQYIKEKREKKKPKWKIYLIEIKKNFENNKICEDKKQIVGSFFY